jgi:hypothetical protein
MPAGLGHREAAASASLCVVDAAGRILRETKVASEPEVYAVAKSSNSALRETARTASATMGNRLSP